MCHSQLSFGPPYFPLLGISHLFCEVLNTFLEQYFPDLIILDSKHKAVLKDLIWGDSVKITTNTKHS